MADTAWSRDPGPDGWSRPTSVRSASAGNARPDPRADRERRAGRPDHGDPRSPHDPRSTRQDYAAAPHTSWASPADTRHPAADTRRPASDRHPAAVAHPPARGRGVSALLAVLALVAATVLGIFVDAARGQQLGTGFNAGIIAGSVLAVLMVRRAGLFPVVVAPPIVYSLGAGISLYLRSGGLHDHGVLIDAATNWLVYGFPAIAAATAAVLIIGGIRLVIRR